MVSQDSVHLQRLQRTYSDSVHPLGSGLWDQRVYPHFCDTRESPLSMGGWSLGGHFCCITEVVISHSPAYDYASSCSWTICKNTTKIDFDPRLCLRLVPNRAYTEGEARSKCLLEFLRYFLQGSLKNTSCPSETWLFPPKQRDTTIYKAMFRCIM